MKKTSLIRHAVCLGVLAAWVRAAPLPDDFNPGANGRVSSLAVQADGKILVGGQFTTVGGIPRSRIARLNPDGTVDSGFNPGANFAVPSVAMQGDGKILLGGNFTTLGGQSRSRIARLNPDGTVDSGFNPGANGPVYGLAAQADGKILVGGLFTTVSGEPRSRIARLNADGTLDEGFNPGANDQVGSLATQADGKILVGGHFTALGGQSRGRIARLNTDGTLDEGFNPEANGPVSALAVQADGQILVGGDFTTVGGEPRSRIARLNADGTLDEGFNPGANDRVYSLALQANGKILVGGHFTAVGGQPRDRIARFNADGTVDTGFNPGASGNVYPLAVQANGEILVGGEFTSVGGQSRNRIARLNNTAPATQTLDCDGTTITWLRGGTSPEVWRTTFEHSSDGGSWTRLGAGSRITGGWQWVGVSLTPGGTFRARGYVAGDDDGSGWFVEDFCGLSFFTTQPGSQTNEVGSIATFRAVAAGSEPLSYRWFKDEVALEEGGNIAGASSPTLILSNVYGNDAGHYWAVASNPVGSVTSRVATLTVKDPVILTHPQGWRAKVGIDVTISLVATGTPPLQYQWFREGTILTDGSRLNGTTTDTLEILNVSEDLLGGYYCAISNPYGAVTSTPAAVVFAATSYVWQDSPNPSPPYNSWATAAHVIQDAVDQAVDGDTVLVTNGVYATGGRAIQGSILNRVAINKSITVQSLMGPEGTSIIGASGVRCAYVGANAVLSGFTLTGGRTRTSGGKTQETGGGVWGVESGIVTNCMLVSNWAHNDGGGVHGGSLYNCTLTGNSADDDGGGASDSVLFSCVIANNSASGDGGGAEGSTLYDCTLVDNRSKKDGGATDECTLYRCLLAGNEARGNGGAVDESTLHNCVLEGNQASDGGGAAALSALTNCTLTGNAGHDGGGAVYSVLRNCVLTDNSAKREGGGAWECALYNCTVSGNSGGEGGGVHTATLYNSIVYHNQALIAPNHRYSTFSYSCTAPLPDGDGNISEDPQLASWTHLSARSPCVGAGSLDYAEGVDMDGQSWANPPSMGADELIPGESTGLLTVNLKTRFSKVTVGFVAPFEAVIDGQTTGNRWSLGDGTVQTNQLEILHAWATPGTFVVRLTAFNDAHPDGVSVTAIIQVVETPVFYVSRHNRFPAYPYTTWETAATSIQEAINASDVAGRWVWVAAGVYDRGGIAVEGEMTNRIALLDGVTVQSVNGPEQTWIQGAPATNGTNGDGAIRCAYVGPGSVLSGFTLSNGHTRTDGHASREQGGGGAWSAQSGVLTNCILTGNTAHRDGGGVNGGTLYRCLIRGNTAGDDSGGADDAVLHDCTVSGNFARNGGGGTSESVLYRCMIISNSVSAGDQALPPGVFGEGGGVRLATLFDCVLKGNSAYAGGGAAGARLYNCLLTGNSASSVGGGALGEALFNSTVVGNSAGSEGGGVFGSTLLNCISYHNTAPDNPNYTVPNPQPGEPTPPPNINHCCTFPMPSSGLANITNEPAFRQVATGDYHLAEVSPCIDAGTDLSHLITTDLEGRPRPLDGNGDGIAAFDMGAYEFRPPTPAERVEALIARVIRSGLAKNRIKPLLATLEAAVASFERESLRSGVNQLRAFQNKVRAQVTPADPDMAVHFVAAAQEIIDKVRAAAGLRIKASGAKAALVWQQGVLQEAEALDGPWHDVSKSGSPCEVDAGSGQKFYRVKLQ